MKKKLVLSLLVVALLVTLAAVALAIQPPEVKSIIVCKRQNPG